MTWVQVIDSGQEFNFYNPLLVVSDGSYLYVHTDPHPNACPRCFWLGSGKVSIKVVL